MSIKIAQADIARITEKIYREKELDFRRYKKNFLTRRLLRRLKFNNITNFSEYLEKIDQDETEYQTLLNDLVLQVSEFFRDPVVFDYLDAEIIPRILETAARELDGNIKVWCPGCSKGEEVFSVAILFLEHLSRLGQEPRLLIYGTDISEKAMEAARSSVYPPEQVNNISPGLLKKYFIWEQGRYRVKSELKTHIKMGRHDLITNPPINHLQLLVCRNVAIYLEREQQEDIFLKFVFALEPGGYLVLGKGESLTEDTRKYFNAVNHRLKIFRKK